MTSVNPNALIQIEHLNPPLAFDPKLGKVVVDAMITPYGEYASRDEAQAAGVPPGCEYFITTSSRTLLRKLRETTSAANNRFGWGVALNSNGTLAAISCLMGDVVGTDCGYVGIYSIDAAGTSSWLYTIKSPTPFAGSMYGMGVAMSADGTKLAVGERHQGAVSTGTGKVHLYTLGASSATYITTVSPSNTASIDFTRVALAGNGNTLFVGDPTTATVEVFDTTTFTAPVSVGSVGGYKDVGNFGTSVTSNFSGSEFLATSSEYYYDVISITSKSPFAYTRQSNATPKYQLLGDYSIIGSDYPVAMTSSGYMLVNGSQPATGGQISVVARVGTKLSPTFGVNIRDATAVSGDMFGKSVAVSGDGTRILVGAPMDSTKAPASGTVYLYSQSVVRSLRVMDDTPTSSTTPNEVSGFVANTGGSLALDNITVASTGAGNAFTLRTVSGALTYDISGTCTYGANADTIYGSSRGGLSMTTTPAHPFAWAGAAYKGNTYNLRIVDRTNSKVYDIAGTVGDATNKTFLQIKRISG